MREFVVYVRHSIIRLLYKFIFKPLVFRIDPEMVHDATITMGRFLGSNPITRALSRLSFSYHHPTLVQTILGIRFRNPIGLAAGFDKNAQLMNILPDVGFGFEEVGSITAEYCDGNPKPRLWRLPKSRALVVYYGLKNDGAEIISERLKNKSFRFPVGISIAKTNSKKTVDTDAGIADYFKAYRAFKNIGDYFTINISCPNTYGGEPFVGKKKLDRLLSKIDTLPAKKPVFIKISPDLSETELDDIISVSKSHHVSGFVCTNLTKDRTKALSKIRDKGLSNNGGISGKVVEGFANEFIAKIYQKTRGKYVIIGVGGIFNASDAYRKIRLGASLVQLITGAIFEGPQLIGDINHGLVRLLKKDGLSHISEAVGLDNKILT